MALTLEEIILCVLIRVVRTPDDVERRPARHHLKHQHTKGPPVHTETYNSRQKTPLETFHNQNTSTSGAKNGEKQIQTCKYCQPFQLAE